jgi:hypothetical protein
MNLRISLLAGALFLTIPLVAQQEVDPDHFDHVAVASQKQKPAPGHRKAANAQSKHTAMNHGSTAPKSTSEPKQVSAVKTDSVTVPGDSRR